MQIMSSIINQNPLMGFNAVTSFMTGGRTSTFPMNSNQRAQMVAL